MVERLFRAACTWTAVALAASAAVVWPLNVSVNVPVVAPEIVTVCTTATPSPPSARLFPTTRTPWLTNVVPLYVFMPSRSNSPLPVSVRSEPLSEGLVASSMAPKRVSRELGAI